MNRPNWRARRVRRLLEGPSEAVLDHEPRIVPGVKIGNLLAGDGQAGRDQAGRAAAQV